MVDVATRIERIWSTLSVKKLGSTRKHPRRKDKLFYHASMSNDSDLKDGGAIEDTDCEVQAASTV